MFWFIIFFVILTLFDAKFIAEPISHPEGNKNTKEVSEIIKICIL